MAPKISVIIPTYYRNEVVQEAIESVLAQSYEPVELIVVDDSGEGHAEPVLREYDEVKAIIRDKNGNNAQAYMTGIEASTGEYIQLLDDDDWLLEEKLLKTAEILEENPEVGVSYCGVMRHGERHYPIPAVSGDVFHHALRLDTFPCCTISMLIRREVLMDTMPLHLVDLGLIIDLAQRTKFDYVDDCLAYYRRSTSRKWRGMNMFEEVKRVFQEKRPLYDQHPSIRNDVFGEWYEREGRARLEERWWSPQATLAFLKSTYYTDTRRFQSGAQFIASLFGRPGLNALIGVNSRVNA